RVRAAVFYSGRIHHRGAADGDDHSERRRGGGARSRRERGCRFHGLERSERAVQVSVWFGLARCTLGTVAWEGFCGAGTRRAERDFAALGVQEGVSRGGGGWA